MANYRKVIAVCGVWLYEEKEYNFIKELNKACAEKGYVVMAFNFSIETMNVDEDAMREKKILELMEHLDCAAVIILGESVKGDRMLDYIKRTVDHMKVPTFALEQSIEGCYNISMRFGDGFKDMVRHIIEYHGCRNVNMIAGIPGNEFSEDRIKAYKEVLAENNIPFDENKLFYGDFWERPAKTAVEKMIDSGDIPEAIICANDVMAVASCQVLHERGYKVPEDVIVSGFDGIESAKVNFPSISSVAPDYEQEVSIIFDILSKLDSGIEVDKNKTYYSDFKMVVSHSCGCKKNNDRETLERVSVLSTLSNDQKWHMMTLNRLLLNSEEMDRLSDMTPLVEQSVELWLQNLYFVAIYEQFMEHSFGEDIKYVKEDSCVSMLRMQDSKNITDPTPFSERELMPGLKELFIDDNGYDMFMVRLLNTKSDLYGYIIEGIRNVDARSLRRCEEFGLFLSTAINSVLRNEKLMLLNEKLRRINKEMEQASIRDYLTELYNRRGFYDELYKIVHDKDNEDRYLTFFSIDMDGLKIINDTYGHVEGDFALKALASAIKHFAVRNGICARYGGDEFVCAIVTDMETNLEADTVRARFQATFNKNTELLEKPYKVGASVGSKCHIINSTLNLEEVMRIADEKMYADKTSRRMSRE